MKHSDFNITRRLNVGVKGSWRGPSGVLWDNGAKLNKTGSWRCFVAFSIGLLQVL